MTAQHATERAPRPQPKPYTSTDMVGFLRFVQERFEAYAATFEPSQTGDDLAQVADCVDLATRWIEETEFHVASLQRDLDESRAAHQASDAHAVIMEDEASALREENRDLRSELDASRAECEQLKQREIAITEREKRLERSTQSFLADRARNAVARDEKPKILVITTTRICEAVLAKGQDPVKALPGPDYFSFLFDLSRLGIEHAPRHMLLDPVVRCISGGKLEAAPDVRRVLEDARLWMHRVSLTMEEVTKQSAFFQARLLKREQTLRAAVDGMEVLQGEIGSLLEVLQVPSK